MALTRLFIHDTFYDATDNYTYTPGMRLTLDNTTQSARITRLQNSGVVSTDETIDPAGVAITGGNIDGTVIGATTAAAGTFTTLTVSDSTSTRFDIQSTGATDTHEMTSLQMDTSSRFTIQIRDSAATFLANTYRIEHDANGATKHNWYLGASVTEMVLDSTGLGIGTTSPGAKLHVFSGSATVAVFERSTTGNSTIQVSKSDASLFFGISSSGKFAIDDDADLGSAPAFFVDPASGAGYFAGNVGIGTSTPAATLDARRDDDGYVFRAYNSTSNLSYAEFSSVAYFWHSGTPLRFGTSSNHGLELGTNNSVRVVINSSGNVGINETAPDYALDVDGTFGFTPGASVTPVDNGDVVFEATNNTTFTVKLKGTDGTVRSGTLTLA